MREHPALKDILKLVTPSVITPPDNTIYHKAFKYFIDNFNEKYSRDYNSTQVIVAFLPCTELNVYAKPSECFINLECTIMQFKAIRQDLRFQAEQFGVCQHPSSIELLNRLREISRLRKNILQNEDKAKEIFEYLASQQGNFTSSDWDILNDLKFIPNKSKIRPYKIILMNPRSCFFKGQEERYILCYFYIFSYIYFFMNSL